MLDNSRQKTAMNTVDTSDAFQLYLFKLLILTMGRLKKKPVTSLKQLTILPTQLLEILWGRGL